MRFRQFIEAIGDMPTHIPKPKKKGSNDLTFDWEDESEWEEPTEIPEEEEYEDVAGWSPTEEEKPSWWKRMLAKMSRRKREEEEGGIDFSDIDFSKEPEKYDPSNYSGKTPEEEMDVSYLPLTNRPQRVKSRDFSSIDPTHAMYDDLKRGGHQVKPEVPPLKTVGGEIRKPPVIARK